MSLWRLEWLRLLRTKRLIALVGVYVFFGLVGPLTARYLGEIVERFGGEVTVVVPDPVPPDGIAQYLANASQIGILVAVVVAAGALVLDARPEMAIFLRTRVRPVRRILVSRYVVAAGAVIATYLLGLALAWYETAVLLGSLSVGGMLVGALYHAMYVAFAVAIVAAIGSRASSVLATVGISVVVLLLLPLVGVMEAVGEWLPSHLIGAQVGLLVDQTVGDYLLAAGVTLASIILLLVVARRGVESREL